MTSSAESDPNYDPIADPIADAIVAAIYAENKRKHSVMKWAPWISGIAGFIGGAVTVALINYF